MVFKIMSSKVFSNFSIGFNGFKWCVSKCFQIFRIGFNGFQIMCFIFNVFNFQSVFKFPHRFSMVFKIMCFKVFSNFPIGFNGFQIMCFQSIFQFSWFQWFSNHLFQSVFKFPHRFQWFSKLCVSKSFQNYVFSKCFQISP